MIQDLAISVIVAAYNSPAGLGDLVESLDRQTLPADRFEVIFVDDGSTDDTLARLEAFAETRPNYKIMSIPHSGWPSKPRNTAISIARGKFVFFSDHDDYIFPEALERMNDLAEQTNCDAIHPKEVVEGWSAPGWNGWQSANQSLDALADSDVQCITPHKLYKTSFLRAQHILYPENKIRLEDFSFNAQVWSKTSSIAILSDYPCYKWIIYANNTHKSAYDFEAYWDSFVNSIQPILGMSDANPSKMVLLRRWYRSRLLERLGSIYATFSDEYREKLNRKFKELVPFFPPVIDSGLTYTDRLRSSLLRKGEFSALLEMARFDTGVRMLTETEAMTWSNGALLSQVTMTVVMADKSRCEFENKSGYINRVLPEAVTACFSELELRELALRVDELDVEFAIRSRITSVDWVMPKVQMRAMLPKVGERGPIELQATAVIDPRSAAFGSPLGRGIWDCFARILGLGLSVTQRVAVLHTQTQPALIDGNPVIPYSTKDGFLALDVGATYRTLVGSARPSINELSSMETGLRIHLKEVHTIGESTQTAFLELKDGKLKNATLESNSSRAYLIVDCEASVQVSGSRAIVGGRRSAPLFT